MADEEPRAKANKSEQKSESRTRDAQDVLVAHSVFPDPAAVFTTQAVPLAEAKKTASIVLDTNALLVPYGIGAQTLSQIERTYRSLLAENRLRIPAQVAREFARNRVTKLSELHQKLSRRRSQQAFQQGSYPLLEHLEEYKRLREVEKKLDELASEYRKLTTAVLEHVKSWEWNDPVSALYSSLFSESVIVDTSKSAEDVKREHGYRFLHKIPPGYKDEPKDDGGIGDYLIWLAILEAGKARMTSLIFVTGEEKADWWHRSEGQPLYPRFELVDEYRRASGGRSFHIIRFSELLELFGASSEVVAEVREEESATTGPAPMSEHTAVSIRRIRAERAVAEWLIGHGYSVQPASMQTGYDFVIDGSTGKFAIDILYASSRASLLNRFRPKHLQHGVRWRRPLVAEELPLIVVVVGEEPDILELAEQLWLKHQPGFHLCTGLLSPDGQFQLRRPF